MAKKGKPIEVTMANLNKTVQEMGRIDKKGNTTIYKKTGGAPLRGDKKKK